MMDIKLVCLLSVLLIGAARANAKLPNGAIGAYTNTTKGGARYVVYTPVDGEGCPAAEQSYYWWRNLPWNGNEAPYAKVQVDIDRAIREGTTPIKLSRNFKNALDKKPWDSLLSYQWAYSSWLARKQVKTRRESDEIFEPVVKYLPEVKFPNTYRYARMMFLTVSYNRQSRYLRGIGDRLLARNPKDEDVKFQMIRILRTTMLAPDDKRSFAYLKYFQKRYPGNHYYDREYAITLEYVWERKYPLIRSKAELAIDAFRMYLRKDPTAIDRKAILARIADIQTRQKDWETWGAKNQVKLQARYERERRALLNKEKADAAAYQAALKAQSHKAP